ncbi:SpoIIE family protein phosphatase [Catenulispora subtropica]
MDAPAAHRRFRIEAEEDVGVLRRAVRLQTAGLPGLPEGDAELVATELATNLLRHAGGGQVLTRATGGGMELIAVDRGPGLSAPARDSLAGARITPAPGSPGGLGVGLATVRRRARIFDYYSDDRGTVVLARLGAVPEAVAWVWGGVNVPLGGEGPSGDAFAVAADGCLRAVLVDGIGHGPDAAAAAHAAILALDHAALSTGTAPEAWLTGLVNGAHQELRGTRGAVLGACVIDPVAGQAVFCGIGNINGRVHTATSSPHLVSLPGTLGAEATPPRIRPAVHPWTRGATLIMATDGIDTRWDPAEHPGLTRRHPTVVAAVLHRDHARGRDDAAILVARATGTGQETT